MKNNGLLLIILGIGGYMWFASTQSATQSPTTAGATGGATPPPGLPPIPASSPTATPAAWSGPSLAQMYQNLQSIVVAQLGIDPALTCTQGMQGLGIGTGSRGSNLIAGTPIETGIVDTNTVNVGPHGAVAGGVAPRTTPSVRNGGGCVPGSIQATYEVFNYYLLQAAPAIGMVPNAPAGNPPVSLSDYWNWAGPMLQAQIAGLSGLSAFPVMRLTRPGNGEYQGPKQARSYMYGRWSA
jgi:hypothetical protein